ncbi:hypothetical protein [Saccharopolyspora cebuensis]|uniref:hypothetical protein n=1 Tax=Saccharopolyspora cebuensis TaxID=418759 RepID=UPI0031ED2EEF
MPVEQAFQLGEAGGQPRRASGRHAITSSPMATARAMPARRRASDTPGGRPPGQVGAREPGLSAEAGGGFPAVRPIRRVLAGGHADQVGRSR